MTKSSGLYTFIRGTQRFRRILYDNSIMPLTNSPDFIDLARCPIEMSDHNDLHFRINFEGSL